MFHDLEGRGVLGIVSGKIFSLRVPHPDLPIPLYFLGTLEHWNKTSFSSTKSCTYLVPTNFYLGTNGTDRVEQGQTWPCADWCGVEQNLLQELAS
jgi:hypothetical protein